MLKTFNHIDFMLLKNINILFNIIPVLFLKNKIFQHKKKGKKKERNVSIDKGCLCGATECSFSHDQKLKLLSCS